MEKQIIKKAANVEKIRQTKAQKTKKFLRVECSKCKNKQIIFGRATTIVKCLKCSKELSVPRGGKAFINGKVLEELS